MSLNVKKVTHYILERCHYDVILTNVNLLHYFFNA